MSKNEILSAYTEINGAPESDSIEEVVLTFADRMRNRMTQKKPTDADIGVYHPLEMVERMHKNIAQLVESYRLGVENPTAAVDIANLAMLAEESIRRAIEEAAEASEEQNEEITAA